MKIIILGAGQVGATVAEQLANEANDITVVDLDAERLSNLGDRLDIRTIRGMASFPKVLRQAGADDADLLVAVTNSDEVNMIACQVAYTLFHTPTRIARIRNAAYLDKEELFNDEAIPIDVIISPEQLVTHYIYRLIEYPGSFQVIDFAEGKAQLVAVKSYYGGALIGQQIQHIKSLLPHIEARIVAIYRNDRPILPNAETIIEVDDIVFFITAKNNVRAIINLLRRAELANKKIVIAGGGNIGERLAEAIEARYQVKIIEHNLSRCKDLSEKLESSIVLQGSVSDKDLLVEENISEADVFLALTNDDEANIMSSLLAKQLGAKKVMTIVNNPAYVDLIQANTIDIAIHPQSITIGSLLTHVRRGDMVSVHSLHQGVAEAIEAIAHGDENSSKVVGRTVDRVALPPGAIIGAIVRGDEVIIAHDDTLIKAEDHIILLVVDKKYISEVERLFEVNIGFF